ncbi:unnamed protein product [Lactuca virosa]|uniref:Uncharacterized protein n=1 Tax=Lactuca virosa TaxID=75947 RepID=A0AAU9P5T4_9ASTR|nr:unnamed protein product [Lactuca virosa]
MGTKGCVFREAQIEMGFRDGGLLQFPKKVKETLRSISTKALAPLTISVLNFDAYNGKFEKIHKDFSQEWGNVCSIYDENSFKMDLSNLDTLYMRQLQLFQKVKVEQGSIDFNSFYERLAPIFHKTPQQSSHKVSSQPWEPKDFYYPLAAKAATISVLNFGASNFGFDAFYKKLHKQDSYQSGDYRIKHGNCRMTRSYRNVQPIVAKASNREYNCMPKVMTTIATTAIAASLKNQPMLREILMRVAMSMASEFMAAVMRVIAQDLISQTKLQKLLMMGAITRVINFPLGMCREHNNRVPAWLTPVLVAIPYISITVNAILMPKATAPYTLAATVLGLYLGCMAEE